jgi:4-diphosphocytidyl-2-C-methyl-D-erythritol kinase
MTQLSLKAPAKLNLLLGVTPHVVNGKHLISTIFSTINLSDTLTFTFDKSQPRKITLEVISAAGITPLNLPMEQNLAYKAVLAMEEFCGKKLTGHLHIVIDKYIPSEGGLAGGSSDAAATLKAISTLWEIDPLSEPVLAAAYSLGADVTFFLYGGCALMGGSGERLIRILPQPKLDFVLVKPEGGVSTKAAYEAFDADPQVVPPLEQLVQQLQSKVASPSSLAKQFANNLYPAARLLMPELDAIRFEMSLQEGVDTILLTGSGSTTFGVCESAQAAARIAKHFGEKGYWAKACMTVL